MSREYRKWLRGDSPEGADDLYDHIDPNEVKMGYLVIQGLGMGSFYAGYLVSACKRDNSSPNLLSTPANNQIYGALALGYPKFKYKNWMERRPPKIKWI